MLSTKQGILNVLIGVSISLFNAVIQFLTMYFILQEFGTQFNGYVRVMTSAASIFSAADCSLGIATVLLLIKPLMNNDWITANEIYSTARKNYKKQAWVGLILMTLVSLAYPLYVSVGGIDGILNADSWKNAKLDLVDSSKSTSTNDFLNYWELMVIGFFLGFKNFATAFFFGVYENIISADNKGAVRRVVILLCDSFLYGTFIWLICVNGINPVIPFIVVAIYSPFKGLLCYLYVRKKYPWLKFYKDFNNFKLLTVSKKISAPSIGVNLLQNVDIAIVSVLLGLNVSSYLSLYMVIGLNVRVIMLNFITSFREYFTTLIAKNGRIYWKSYVKYELYTYIVAGFTFINMSIIAPYFVSSLYWSVASKSLDFNSNDLLMIKNLKALDFIFHNFWFSGLFGLTISLSLMSESQMTLIQAKGQTNEIAKFQNINGALFIIFAALSCLVCGRLNSPYALVYGIVAFYLFKSFFLITRYCYLWIFVWKFVTYNSSLSYVFQNLMNFVLSILGTAIVVWLILGSNLSVKSVIAENKITTLLSIYSASVFGSIFYLFVISIALEPILFAGIFKNLPIISEFVGQKRRRLRKKRLEENEIIADDFLVNKEFSKSALLNMENEINNTSQFEEMIDKKEVAMYKIKG